MDQGGALDSMGAWRDGGDDLPAVGERGDMGAILHLDMDAYFASLEQARDPALRGEPVVVGGVPGQRATVASASYEARAYGVRAGMPIGEAARRCPRAAFRPVDVALVRRTTRRIFEILGEYSPCVEPAGWDEAFLEVAGDALAVARAIQVRLERELGLSCSFGVSESKALARMASSFEKPRGLTTLWRADVESKLWSRPVATLHGVGPCTAARLGAHGLATVGDLARCEPERLAAVFGSRAAAWQRDAHGQDAATVTPIAALGDARSIGHAHTPEQDLVDRAAITTILDALATRIARRAQRGGLAGRRLVLAVGIVEPSGGVRSRTFSRKLHAPISGEEALRHAARRLMQRALPEGAVVRRLGVTLHELERVASRQLSLGV